MSLIELELCEKCYRRLKIKSRIVKWDKCILCSGLLWRIDEICRRIANSFKEYEFETFNVGTKIDGTLKYFEDFIFKEFNLENSKRIKHSFNRKLAECLSRLFGKKINYTDPDIIIIYNPESDTFEFSVKPLYIYGRYKKRVRNIPQTRWLCNKCEGVGCELCNFTGRKYSTSVEEYILNPLLEISRGEDGYLHGAGREDIDVRMLGNGRPFVVEIKNPRVRKIDLKKAEEEINKGSGGKVVVSDLKFVKKRAVEYLKSGKFKKKYRAKVVFGKEIELDRLLKALEKLKNTKILQRTPKRVEHRRADIVRERRTYNINLILHKRKLAVIEIEAEAGLYIKELINGDEGRTRPSLAEILNTDAEVAKLDVIKVEGGLPDGLEIPRI